jgi:hypothetical protein
LVKRLLGEGDSTGEPVVKPKGTVYVVRSELGGDVAPGASPGQRNIMQSLQLWCDGQPWRLFEELVDYRGPKHTRFVQKRSWLIAVGHSEK